MLKLKSSVHYTEEVAGGGAGGADPTSAQQVPSHSTDGPGEGWSVEMGRLLLLFDASDQVDTCPP